MSGSVTKRALAGAAGLALLGWGCATTGAVGTRAIDAVQARAEVPEAQRLDVSVEVFDPGIPDLPPPELEKQGIYVDLRQSEARFVPVHLKSTLEQTGQWGAVRVVPDRSEGAELVVSGRIVTSNGKHLVLEIVAHDATGRRWMQRTFSGEADPMAYAEDQIDDRDPFQSLYNAIANELLELRSDLSSGELEELREVARLRFARDLAPAAFGEHVEQAGERWELVRLPADGDPMLERVANVRQRDGAFVDALNGHYSLFYEQMSATYDDWRMYSYVEQDAVDDLKKSSLIKRILGGAAIVGALFLDGDSNSYSGAEDLARQAAILAGLTAIRAGNADAAQVKMHRLALEELAASFEADVEPLLVDVEGATTRLSGSVEAQYAEWRQLLHRLFEAETGLVPDPNTVVVGVPEPSGP